MAWGEGVPDAGDRIMVELDDLAPIRFRQE
jgi:hypothetical protein